MYKHACLILIPVTLLATITVAEVQEFVDDKDGWMEAVEGAESFNMIDFTDYPKFTFITDQYSDMGIHFTDGNDNIQVSPSIFPNDTFGLDGNTSTTIEFDSPQNFFATDHPGDMRYHLFWQDEEFYDSGFAFANSGAGNFSGIISTQPFNAMFITPIFTDVGFEVNFDDIYFGTIPAPGALPLLGLALLAHRRRRRR